jgi:hypothetical protein
MHFQPVLVKGNSNATKVHCNLLAFSWNKNFIRMPIKSCLIALYTFISLVSQEIFDKNLNDFLIQGIVDSNGESSKRYALETKHKNQVIVIIQLSINSNYIGLRSGFLVCNVFGVTANNNN